MNDFESLIKEITQKKLTLNAYLVLYSIFTKDNKLINNYVTNCEIIHTSTFDELEARNLIKISSRPDNTIFLENLSLTEDGTRLINSLSTAQLGNFDDFRKHYPSMVKRGKEIRRLHSDLSKCKTLYRKLLLETSHEILCKCATAYYNEKKASGSEMFIQDMRTWLNQKNYLQYVDDIDKIEEENRFTDDI